MSTMMMPSALTWLRPVSAVFLLNGWEDTVGKPAMLVMAPSYL